MYEPLSEFSVLSQHVLSWTLYTPRCQKLRLLLGAISRSRHAYPVGAVSNRAYSQTLENTQFSPASSIHLKDTTVSNIQLLPGNGEDFDSLGFFV